MYRFEYSWNGSAVFKPSMARSGISRSGVISFNRLFGMGRKKRAFTNRWSCSIEGAPEAFHTLYDLLKTGAGASGVPFTPEAGYLQAREFGKASENDQTALPWASKEMGFSLQESANGLWIEGAALEIVWDAVNAHPGGLVFQDGEMLYILTLQVPGLSRMEPPAK